MSKPILLKDKVPSVDRDRIGISYSGGGPLVLVELGIARAFVKLGIIPAVIAGVSAGALAGAAHALDPKSGAGIDLAASLLAEVSNRFFGLDPIDIVARVVREREHTTRLGDNAPIGPLIRDALARTFDLTDVTVGTFASPTYPKLIVGATD
jgi:predicted acylesterase/phospholipase RssA